MSVQNTGFGSFDPTTLLRGTQGGQNQTNGTAAAITAGIQGLGMLAAAIITSTTGAQTGGTADASQTTSLTDFQNTIFQQNDGKISKEKLAEIYQRHDTDGVEGLSSTEYQQAMVDVNNYITSSIQSATDTGNAPTLDQVRDSATELAAMTPEQQAQSIVDDLKVLAQRGAQITVENGQVMYDGQAVDLKSMGASDESIEIIKTEIERFVAEQAGRSQDE